MCCCYGFRRAAACGLRARGGRQPKDKRSCGPPARVDVTIARPKITSGTMDNDGHTYNLKSKLLLCALYCFYVRGRKSQRSRTSRGRRGWQATSGETDAPSSPWTLDADCRCRCRQGTTYGTRQGREDGDDRARICCSVLSLLTS
jgi:hypothetical protein